jgi:hypothetical protein
MLATTTLSIEAQVEKTLAMKSLVTTVMRRVKLWT